MASPENKEFLAATKYGDLNDNQLAQVQNLLVEFRDCFALDKDPLGFCAQITHDIKTLTDEPVVSQPYRIPKSQEPEVRKIIQEMLNRKFIQKSHSEYSSPVVLVEKPDKSLDCDYQKLNAISKKRTFPLPNPDELLAKVGENHPKWCVRLTWPPPCIRCPSRKAIVTKPPLFYHGKSLNFEC